LPKNNIISPWPSDTRDAKRYWQLIWRRGENLLMIAGGVAPLSGRWFDDERTLDRRIDKNQRQN
jgi:hypothetical protein